MNNMLILPSYHLKLNSYPEEIRNFSNFSWGRTAISEAVIVLGKLYPRSCEVNKRNAKMIPERNADDHYFCL